MEGLQLERLDLQQNGLRNVSGLEGAEIQQLLLQDSQNRTVFPGSLGDDIR